MVSKLATFRTDDETWERFQTKAKANGTNASALLQKFVRDYLDDKLDSRIDSPATPDVYEEIERQIAKIDEHYSELFNTVQDRIIDVHRNVMPEAISNAIAPLLARLEAVETKLSTEATAPANFTPALLQKAKAVAPLKLKEVA